MSGLYGNPDIDDTAHLYAKFLKTQKKTKAFVVKDWREQERVPAGEPGAGEWGSGGGTATATGDRPLAPTVTGVRDNPELRARAVALADSMGTEFSFARGDDALPSAAIEGIIRSAEAFHEQYPEARFSINTHDMSQIPQYKDTLALTMRPGAFNLTASEITFNTAFFGESGKAASAWSECVAAGFHPVGTGLPNLDNVQRGADYPKEATAAAAQAVTDHELGHVLGNYIGLEAEKDAVYDGLDKAAGQVSDISLYAEMNEREAVGEAAAMVRGTSPSPAATAIMDYMTEAYKEKAA